jgi:hypothetical protein
MDPTEDPAVFRSILAMRTQVQLASFWYYSRSVCFFYARSAGSTLGLVVSVFLGLRCRVRTPGPWCHKACLSCSRFLGLLCRVVFFCYKSIQSLFSVDHALLLMRLQDLVSHTRSYNNYNNFIENKKLSRRKSKRNNANDSRCVPPSLPGTLLYK